MSGPLKPSSGAIPTSNLPEIPKYLKDVYHWAYLSRVGRKLLDRPVVVSAILWGNARRLMESAANEFEPGQKVLQTACVYGDFSPLLARRVGPRGQLTVIDVAPIQTENCQRKLEPYPQARVQIADASSAPLLSKEIDGVCCFFLLHEVPEEYKSKIVDNVLNTVVPGGKVVFTDYHRPKAFHPLKGIMALVFHTLEPYAMTLWDREIQSYATQANAFRWEKNTYFGGLYQKVVATRL